MTIKDYCIFDNKWLFSNSTKIVHVLESVIRISPRARSPAKKSERTAQIKIKIFQ